ncbi:hypothetical protein BN130_173 [Cronobacter malonaticus 507]|nr:hypothetical protein BN130_173 [Cronobacter malonaticus 507]
MAAVVFTVGVAVARRAALVAVRDHVVRNTLAHTFVKHEVFTDETHRQPLFARFAGVFDDAAFNMPDFLETVVTHERARFFTADAAGTVHDNFLVFVVLHHLDGFRQLFTKRIRRDLQRVFEMAHFIFVVVTHIDEHGVRIVKHGVHFRRLEIFTHVARVKRRIVDAVRHDAVTHFHTQHPERFPVVIQRNVQTHAIKRWMEAVQRGAKRLDIAFRNAYLRVDAFVGKIDTAKDIQRGERLPERVARGFRIVDGEILIE